VEAAEDGGIELVGIRTVEEPHLDLADSGLCGVIACGLEAQFRYVPCHRLYAGRQ
jgi:hypothetical protein